MTHVENYIRVQAIRYPDRIFYMSDIAPELLTQRLPQYIIHTFVENTFKHALSYKDMLSIFIKAERVDKYGQAFIQIMIEDDGDGFPAEVIDMVHTGEFTHREQGEQVGILNIHRTLKLLYKRDDLLRLSNMEPSGARVEILIPTDHEST